MTTSELNEYFKGVRRDSALLQKDVEYELIKKAQAGDEEATQKLITANLRLVIYIAKRYKFTNASAISMADLIQEGNLGLYNALRKFNTDTGNKFSTYATWWIRQNITRYISRNARTVRIPIKMSELLSKYNKALNTLEIDLGRPPVVEELAAYLDVTPERIELMKKSTQDNKSFDASTPGSEGEGREITLEDVLEDTTLPDANLTLEQVEANNDVANALATLPDRERDIIMSLYGFYNRKVTKKELSDKYNLGGTSKVTIIENNVKSYLKRQLKTNPFDNN